MTSFASILLASLQKESYSKGWCQTSKSYEPFKQLRDVKTLPQVLSILIYICNFHVLSNLLLNYICKLHWNRNTLPQVLAILCGDTFQGPSSGTISLSEKKHVSYLEMFWSTPNLVGGHWLPQVFEVVIYANGNLVVSEQLRTKDGEVSSWLVFDGKTETICEQPASAQTEADSGAVDVDSIFTMELLGVLSSVFTEQDSRSKKSSGEDVKGHQIVHVRLPSAGSSSEVPQWFCFNDFFVSESTFSEATLFEGTGPDAYRHPSIVMYGSISPASGEKSNQFSVKVDPDELEIAIPASVFSVESLSAFSSQPISTMPGKGDIIAFDGEFVLVEAAKASVTSDGKRVASTGLRFQWSLHM